jgi:parvulin-like peptidyl-prolyl isomerase
MGIIGKIGSKTLMHKDYDIALQNYYSYWQNQGIRLTDQKRKELNNQLWEEEIARYIYDEEAKRRMIEPTNDELFNRALQSPPPQILKMTELQRDGKFNNEHYKLVLETNLGFQAEVFNLIRDQLKYEKLFVSIKSEIDVNPDSLYKEWQKKNNTASGKIILFYQPKYAALDVTEKEMQDFYKNNQEMFKRPPHRKFKYIKMANLPSKQDTLRADAITDSLYKVLLAGEDFAQIARQFSQDPGSVSKGGDLGYFGKGRMVKSFEDACWATPVGEISKPILSNYGWHIVKITDKRTTPTGIEEVRASHVLIRYQASPETAVANDLFVNEVYNYVKKKGIDKAVKKYNLKSFETEGIRENDIYTPGLGAVPEVFKFAFENPVGSVPDILNAKNGEKIIMQVSESKGEHYVAYEDEKELVKKLTQRVKNVEKQVEYAEHFVNSYNADEYLAMAERDSLAIVDFEDAIESTKFTRIGELKELSDEIFSTKEGHFTNLVIVDKGVYLAYVSSRNTASEQEWLKIKDSEINKVRLELQEKHMNQWYVNIKNRIKISDYRKSFYEL